MKRLLVVLDAGDRRKSGLVRGLAYGELLAEQFAVDFENRQPLRTMDWIDKLPRVCHKVLHLTLKKRVVRWAAVANEQCIFRRAREVDIVYLVTVRFPFVVALRRETMARVVYDVPDPYWLVPGRSPDAFYEAVRAVDAVTTENELMANHIRSFNPNCTVVPEAPALGKFDMRRNALGKRTDDPIVLGWIGSPVKAYNLYVVWEALEELFHRHPNIHLRLVGTGNDLQLIPDFAKGRFSYRPFYKETEMIEEVFGMHIGLFPLQDVAISRMRSVLKATIYMSGEAAVVASRVGPCVDVIQDGVNGMIAGSTREWVEKLEMLISDADLRRRLTQNGLETVRSQFRLDQSFAKLKKVLLADEASESVNMGPRTTR